MDAQEEKFKVERAKFKVASYFPMTIFCRAVVRRTSGTLRFVDSVRKSFSLSRDSRFIDTASGVFGFLAKAETTR
jgi:hypothetical protein